MSTRRISVEILADASQFERQMTRASNSAEKLGRTSGNVEKDLGRMGKGTVAASIGFKGLGRNIAFASAQFLGAAGFVEVVKKSIDAASSLEEQLSRTEAVFKSSAGTVKAWSKDSADAMGLSRSAALDAANTIGTLLTNVGQTPAKAAAMSKQMVQLAADMAAFKKVKPEEAVQALESGLQGRMRSLKQFGVTIDQAGIKEEAYRDGIAKTIVSTQKVQDAESKLAIARAQLSNAEQKYAGNTTQVAQARLALSKAEQAVAKAQAGSAGQLTASQKALAFSNLIVQQTKNEQGSVAKSSGELSIEEQKLHARLTDIEAEVGQALLPTITQYMGELDKWLEKEQKNGDIHRDVAQAVKILTAAIHDGEDVVKVASKLFGGLADAVGGDKHAIELLVGAFLTLKAAQVANSIGFPITKLAGIGGAATTAEGEVTGLRAALLGLGDATVLSSLGALGAAFALAMAAGKIDQNGGYTPNAPAFAGHQTHTGSEGTTVAVNKDKSITFGKDGSISVNTQHGAIGGSETITIAQAAKLLGMTVLAVRNSLGQNTSGMSNDPMHDAGGGNNRSTAGSGRYSQKQIYALLTANGVPQDVAANLSTISAHGEDPSGSVSVLNNNPKTGDYSVGLFQENFIGRMGVQRVAKYAPQFGLPGNMPVSQFVAWLGQHPSAQAQIAYDIYQEQGYSAWTTAKGLGITGGGAPLPGEVGSLVVGKAPGNPKPAVVTDAALLPGSLSNAISIYAGKASDAATANDVAYWLGLEAKDLEKARADLKAKLGKGSAKQQRATKDEYTAISKQLDQVNADIGKAQKTVADGRFASTVKSQVTKFIAGMKGQTTKYNQLLVQANYDTGQALIDDYDAVAKNLGSQKTMLQAEVAKLTADETGKDPARKKALAAQVARIQTLLRTVGSNIQSNIQNEVNALQAALSAAQSSVSSGWSTYSGEVVSAFEAGTNALLAKLAADPQFFQNGALTDSESKLAAMQAQDQLDQLNQAVTDAQTQLATDMKGTSAAAGDAVKSIQGLADGITLIGTTAGSPGAGPVDAAAVAADQKALAAAKRQLDEYNLSLKAQQERTDADNAYAAAVQKLTADRAEQESELTKVLGQFGDRLTTGAVKLSDLQGWLNGANPEGFTFGLNLQDINATAPLVKSDFDDLSGSAQALVQAFDALIAFVNQKTGSNIPVPPAVASANAASLGAAQGAYHASPTAANEAALIAAARNAGYTQSVGSLRRAGIVPMAVGGDILSDGLVYAHAGETVLPANVSTPYSGGPVAELTLNVLDDKTLAARLIPYIDQDSGSALVRVKISGR